MKVFLPAIKGLVPDAMVRAIAAFIDFCYLVRRSQLDESVLAQVDKAVARFHDARSIFLELGIRDHFNLPRQHSVQHYRLLIQMFGAPNGLCSSITESKHIDAVKDAWRRSSRNHPLGEMLLINQRIDKLAAFQDIMEPFIPLDLRDPRDHRCTIQTSRAPRPPPLHDDDDDDELEDDEEEDDPTAHMITSEGDVRLPQRPGEIHGRLRNSSLN